MNKYEVMYILSAEADDESIDAQIAKFSKLVEDNNGTVDKLDKWGRKRLAFPVNFKNEGYYVLMNMTSAPEFPAELERNFRNTEEVIRFMVVRCEA